MSKKVFLSFLVGTLPLFAMSCSRGRIAQPPPVNNIHAASITIALHDNWSPAVPAEGKGHVKLFGDNNALVQEADSDAAQRVHFGDLDPLEYRFEAYSSDNPLGYLEYWGQGSRRISSGETAGVDFSRTQPYVDTVSGIPGFPYAYGLRFPRDNRGEKLTATVSVRTPDNGDAGIINVQILFDRDKALPVDFTLSCDNPVSAAAGRTSIFMCSFYPVFSPLEFGTYYYSVVVSQNDKITQVRPWTDAFILASHVCGYPGPTHLCGQ